MPKILFHLPTTIFNVMLVFSASISHKNNLEMGLADTIILSKVKSVMNYIIDRSFVLHLIY